jgi:hypothetical protein
MKRAPGRAHHVHERVEIGELTMFRFKLHFMLAALAVFCAAPDLARAQAAKLAAPDDTREANLRAYVELLRSDVRSQRAAILTEVMQFTEDEDAKFWPVYREYEAELTKINDERLALIRDYATNYEAITDDVADRLARGALDLEGRRHALKMKYYDRFKSVLTPKTAARFLQVENQILLLLDLQIAASLPIVQ